MFNVDYDRFRSSHGFAFPKAYLEMNERGWFDSDERHGRPGPSYLWIPDMRWVAPAGLRALLAAPDSAIRLIEFARTPCGDAFCWDLKSTHEGSPPVVLCPYDPPMGVVYAPDFLSAVYRSVLECAARFGGDADDSGDLHRTIEQLGTVLPAGWRQTLEGLDPTTESGASAQGTLDGDDILALLRADLQFSRLDEEFHWMT